nr:hypothetical protein [Tanacetum cinerariifolium]
MLNKDNYIPWSSRIIRYSRSRPNGKMIVDSIENGPYVRRMISTPGEPDLPVPMNQDEVNELRVERLAKTHDPLALMAHSQNSYNFLASHNDQSSSSTHSQQSFSIYNKYNLQSSLNQNVMQPPMTSLEDINNPTEAMNAILIIFAKALQLTAPTNNNQRTSSNPHNLCRTSGTESARVQLMAEWWDSSCSEHCLECKEETIVPGIANESETGNIVAARAEGIQLQVEEFDFMAAAGDLDEIEEVNDNCILMANLQHASTSGIQLDKAPVYDTDSSAENDNHVTFVAPSMVQSGGTVETSSAPNEETRAHRETVYHNLLIKLLSQEKYDKLEKCYQKSVYQEQCLTSKINALHLTSAKQITTLNDEISDLNKQLSKEKLIISSFMEEKKRLKYDFKTQEDKFLDKEVDIEAKIKYLENILLKRDQTVQTMHMLNPKPNLFYHPDQKMALEEHDPPAVYASEETLELAQETKEELFLSNVSNMVTVSKTISIPNEDLSDDTTPSVARKFLNEVKNSLVTLQLVVKQKMTLEVHNWSSSAHKEVHKVISYETAPIINQVDARVKSFEIQFLPEAAKFVRDFKSLAKEADESLDKQNSLELKIE